MKSIRVWFSFRLLKRVVFFRLSPLAVLRSGNAAALCDAALARRLRTQSFKEEWIRFRVAQREFIGLVVWSRFGRVCFFGFFLVFVCVCGPARTGRRAVAPLAGVARFDAHAAQTLAARKRVRRACAPCVAITPTPPPSARLVRHSQNADVPVQLSST